MAIPDFQKIMLPMMCLAADNKVRSIREYTNALADHFGLTDEERKELLPSGKQPRFTNRICWASIYLYKAGLLERTHRAHYQITERGLKVLSSQPEEITVKFLGQFPDFIQFQQGAEKQSSVADIEKVESEDTPEEALESAYQTLKDNLAADLIQTIKKCSPEFFEALVVDLLVKMGYGGSKREAGQAVGKSGDGGIDGIIKEDRLGLDIIYIQAKRWEGNVGRPEIQKFAGALQGNRARKGIFITTSSFTKDARDYAAIIETKIILIDGTTLAELMIEHNVGTTTVASYEIKRVDLDYFLEE